MSTKYQIAYQLGGRGSTHRSITGAARALKRARAAARRGGDCQGIGVRAIDYTAGDPWGVDRALTEDERIDLEKLI